jgi:hypothetical protein
MFMENQVMKLVGLYFFNHSNQLVINEVESYFCPTIVLFLSKFQQELAEQIYIYEELPN